MKPTILPLIAALGMTASVFAQDITEQKITGVDIVVKGAQTVSKSRIRNYMSVRPGQQFSYDKLDDDVKRLYETGLVDDVVFLADPQDNGVRIIAEVKTRPSLRAIDIQGNTVYSDSKLRNEMELTAGGVLNDAAILKGRRALETYYTERGYPDTTVTHRIENGQDGFAILTYQVNEGIKGEVDEIYFHGNNAFAGVELEREMGTKEKGIFSFFTKSGILNSARLEEDKQKLVKFYQNKGYLRAKVTHVGRVKKDNGKVDLNIHIEEGAKYTVSGIGFTGNSVYSYDDLWKALSLIAGDAYSAEKMEKDIRNIRSFYGAKGYSDVKVIPDMQNTANNGVTINYRIQEGSRYRVGKVNIQGNNKTKDHVIRREVPMTPGEWYNSVDLDTTKNRLRNLNYFSFANATERKSNRSGYRDIDIQISEKRTGSLGFGAGFSSIDNVVGFINLEQTNFDLFDPWGFTGGGQRFGMTLRAGAETLDFKLSLTEPWFLGKRLSFGGELYYQNRQYLSSFYDQRNYGGALFLRKPLGKRSYVKGEYRLENVEIEIDNAPAAGSSLYAEEGEFWRSAFTLSYVYDSRKSNITPRSGEKLNLSATYAGGILGGDVNAYTLNATAVKHVQLPFDFILNLNADFTVVDNLTDEPIPIFERTSLGGARDLRGFDYRDVGSVASGTRDAATLETIGGKTSAFFSTEVTFPLVNTIRGAVFGDVGFVNKNAYDFSAEDLHADVGMGLRLNLPFGPFAIDYAIPVMVADQAEDDAKFQFYLDYQF